MEKYDRCDGVDWMNVAAEIGHEMTNKQCRKRWVEMNKKCMKPERLTTTAGSAYVNSTVLDKNTHADKYDAIVERAFNKRGRKMEPEEIRSLWTSDMVSIVTKVFSQLLIVVMTITILL